MKKIPLKNYFLLVLLIAVSVIVVLYCVNWYSRMQKKASILPEYISEIKYDEIDNFAVENPNFIIYLSSKEDNKLEKFETELKGFLIDNDLSQDFIYMDMDQFKFEEFMQKYKNIDNYKLDDDIVMIIFENQKVRDIFTAKISDINMENVKKFLQNNEVY